MAEVQTYSSQHFSTRTDEDLLLAIRETGDQRSYAELWKRHAGAGLRAAYSFKHLGEPDDLVAEAFTRIYAALRTGVGPSGAFRPYLYTTIRNLSLKNVRALAALSDIDLDSIAAPEGETVEAALDRTLTAAAFRLLPERWQTVLWYTEVERMNPAEAGELMGIKANAVSALAFRARNALRGAWLQSHVAEASIEGEHTVALSRIGEFSQGSLSSRDERQVADHLRTCVRCSRISDEVDHVAGRLASIMLPLVLGGGGALILARSIATGAALPLTAATPPPPPGGFGSIAGLSTTASGVGTMSAGLVTAAVLVVAIGGVAAWAGVQSARLTSDHRPLASTGKPLTVHTPAAVPLSSATPAPSPIPTPTPTPGGIIRPRTVPVPPPATPPPAVVEERPIVELPTSALPTLTPPQLAGNTNSYLVNRTRFTVSGTGFPGAAIQSSGLTVATVDPSGNFRWTITGLTEGSTLFQLAQQLGGYHPSSAQSLLITVDTVAPAIPVVTSTWATAQPFAPQFTGTAEPNATVDIFDPTGSQLGAVNADPAGGWTFGVLDGFLPSMSNLTISQTDQAGNTSPTAEVGPFAFTPVFSSPVDGSSVTSAVVPVALTGWPNSTVTITVNGQRFGPFSFNSAGRMTQQLSTNGGPVAPGVYTLEANYCAGTASTNRARSTFTVTP